LTYSFHKLMQTMDSTFWQFPYPSQRMPVLADNAVATSQPLAGAAGLMMLARGGNAVDAALATAIALTVVEPCMNGIGGDAFVQIWDGQRMHALNASGRAPEAATAERYAHLDAMPARGWDSVTVPGAVSAWRAVWEKFGSLPFEDLFEPALRYAREGYIVSPTVHRQWQAQIDDLLPQPGFREAFAPNGRAPLPGERFICPGQAETLEKIACTKGEAFYRGELAAAIAAHARATGGLITEADLATHTADWVDPLSVSYRDIELMEIGPNGQGIGALMALGMLRHFDLPAMKPDSAEAQHLQIEAMKLAFADVYRYVAEPGKMEVTAAQLLDPAYLAQRAKLIDMKRAQDFGAGNPVKGGTIYLTAADESGMMVSFIQSNYMGFGSGCVEPSPASACKTAAAGSPWIRRRPTSWPAASGRSIPSSRAS